jgi:hypothetical protein
MFRFLLLCLPFTLLDAQSPSPERPSLEGIVINAVTNQPIAGARIKLDLGVGELMPGAVISGKTEDEGGFAVRSLVAKCTISEVRQRIAADRLLYGRGSETTPYRAARVSKRFSGTRAIRDRNCEKVH